MYHLLLLPHRNSSSISNILFAAKGFAAANVSLMICRGGLRRWKFPPSFADAKLCGLFIGGDGSVPLLPLIFPSTSAAEICDDSALAVATSLFGGRCLVAVPYLPDFPTSIIEHKC
jgi:hypothetical protein